jgi:hypothetical protein
VAFGMASPFFQVSLLSVSGGAVDFKSLVRIDDY